MKKIFLLIGLFILTLTTFGQDKNGSFVNLKVDYIQKRDSNLTKIEVKDSIAFDKMTRFLSTAIFSSPVDFNGSLHIGDSTQLDTLYLKARTRQVANYDVITANDTLNNQTINITPTSNDVASNALFVNKQYVTINKNTIGKYFYNNISSNYSETDNLNDSINVLYGYFNKVRNTKGYTNQIYANNSQNVLNATLDTTVNKVARVLSGLMQVTCADNSSKNTTNISASMYLQSTYGNYGKVTIDTADNINLITTLSYRAGASLTISKLRGINIDINKGVIGGTVSVADMYGIYLLNRSGVTGGTNHYGIYENFGKNYFKNNIETDGNVDIDDTLFLANKADTITGAIDLTDLGNVDISSSSNPLNTVYLKEFSLEEGANAAMGEATIADSAGVAAVILISTTRVTATTRIFLTYQSCTSCGTPYVAYRTAGASFAIKSTNVLDRSKIAWMLVEPN